MDAIKQLSPEDIGLLKRHGLLRPLLQQLVIAEAIGSEPFQDDELPKALEAYRQQHGLATEEQLDEHLQAQGLDRADLDWQLLVPLRMRAHIQEHYLHKAESRFLGRKNQLDQVIYSLLRVKDGFLARELYLRLAGNEANFADLAQTYAEGPEKDTKGIIGPTPLNQAHPQLAERLRICNPGELMEPFQVADWWLIVQLERRIPANFDAGTAERMGQELFQTWVQEQVQANLVALALPSA